MHREGSVSLTSPLSIAPLNGGIREDDLVLLRLFKRLAERVGVAEIRLFDAVQHQVHGADPQHRHAAVVVEAGQPFRLQERALLGLQPLAGEVVRKALRVVFQACGVRMLLQDVLVGVDQESCRARGGVADALDRLRVDHPHHHADNVARGAELPVTPRRFSIPSRYS